MRKLKPRTIKSLALNQAAAKRKARIWTKVILTPKPGSYPLSTASVNPGEQTLLCQDVSVPKFCYPSRKLWSLSGSRTSSGQLSMSEWLTVKSGSADPPLPQHPNNCAEADIFWLVWSPGLSSCQWIVYWVAKFWNITKTQLLTCYSPAPIGP